MEYQQPTEEAPRRKKLIYVVLVLAIVSVAVYFILLAYLGTKSTTNPQSVAVTNEESVKVLLQRSKLPLPQIVSSSPLPLGSVPQSLKQLILPIAANISAQSINFQNKSSGFAVNFENPQNLLDTYQAFIITKFSDWKRISGIRTDKAAVIEFDSSAYSVRIVITADGGTTKVGILSLTK